MGCLVSLVRRVEIAQRDSLPTVLLGLLVAAGENIPKGRCSREYSMTCLCVVLLPPPPPPLLRDTQSERREIAGSPGPLYLLKQGQESSLSVLRLQCQGKWART